MKGIQIDKNIPIPTDESRRKKVYPFDEMDVGDSFYVNVESHRMSSAAYSFRKFHPEKRFVVRREGKGSRVWRIV